MKPYRVVKSLPHHLKIGHFQMNSADIRSSYELKWFVLYMGLHDNTPGHGRQCDMKFSIYEYSSLIEIKCDSFL